ncbi:MAG: hypothetical protein KTR32_24950 [Granulosicoccus sp.]|nr:hypothetical protein [Granulosicoccus sp.]
MVHYEDMQALARFGHGQLKDSCFLLLNIKDRKLAGQWLQQAPVATAVSANPIPDTALQVSFTAQGLRELGLEEKTLIQFSDEFLGGMSGDENRSRRLGDFGQNAPDNWVWGGSDSHEIHLLLLLYAREGQMGAYVDAICNSAFEEAFHTQHTLPTNTLAPKEPFGFIDGISQPLIDWQQSQRTDVHARQSYSNLLAPGEIVLGYPNEYGQYTHSPTVDASADAQALLSRTTNDNQSYDFGVNGSYLVIRQLEQDVRGFWRYMLEQSGGDAHAADDLAAAIVGRQRDGTPLIPATDTPIPGIPAARSNNHFNYNEDLHGVRCPVSAHIRRSNPRTGDFPPGVNSLWDRLVRSLGFKRRSEYEDMIASTRFHRILRRGRPYGAPAAEDPIQALAESNESSDDPQGLQFVCLTGNILRQFEFVQSAWSESAGFAGTREQRDPILGSRAPLDNGMATDLFMRADSRGAQCKYASIPTFVTVRGGGYFFMPGLKAIRYLAHIASSGHQR